MPATAGPELSTRDFARLAGVVRRHCGINLHDGKRALVEARLGKLVRTGDYASPGDYLEHVLARPADPAFARLIDALSTNLTSFFREPDHFDHLRRDVLPRLLARKAAVGRRRVRAWSAGCSTGEEAYTLAMVLADAVDAFGAAAGGTRAADAGAGSADAWDVKILATDISTRALAAAERGTYDAGRAAGIPPPLLARHFAAAPATPAAPATQAGGPATVIAGPGLRRRIAFRRLNLMDPWPFRGPFDFVFCRNVMIYFDKPTQAALVDRFHQVLAPGGLLFTGHSESLTGVRHRFEFVRTTIYRKS
jgi:chemotaxis protein methyltransferase CheR